LHIPHLKLNLQKKIFFFIPRFVFKSIGKNSRFFLFYLNLIFLLQSLVIFEHKFLKKKFIFSTNLCFQKVTKSCSEKNNKIQTQQKKNQSFVLRVLLKNRKIKKKYFKTMRISVLCFCWFLVLWGYELYICFFPQKCWVNVSMLPLYYRPSKNQLLCVRVVGWWKYVKKYP